MSVRSSSGVEASIKAVTFDVWETLLLERDGWGLKRRRTRCESLARVFGRFDLEISDGEIASAFEKLDSWLASAWEEKREVTHWDQIRFLARTVSKATFTVGEDLVDQLSSAYVSAIFEVPPYLNPDAHGVLRWLKDHNKLVGLICNVGLTPGFGLRKFLAKEKIAEYFDLMIFSDEAGLRKPDPRIFRKAVHEFQLEPFEIVHIGDNLRSDVWGAKNAGFRAIYLSTDVGRDRIAESDPTSLASISRKLNNLNGDRVFPDQTISSLGMAVRAIQRLET